MKRAIAAGLLALLLAGCAAPPPPPARPAIYAELASAGARVDVGAAAEIVNALRRGRGLAPLVPDPALQALAGAEAARQASRGRVARAAPLGTRLAGAGQAGTGREIVSAGYFTISDAFSGWRGVPAHEATLLMAAGRRFGLATAYNPASTHRVFWVMIVTP